MAKTSCRQIKWEEIDDSKRAELRMLFYSSMRLTRRLERKLVQMAEAYRNLEAATDYNNKNKGCHMMQIKSKRG